MTKKKKGDPRGSAHLPRHYEGEGVLGELLALAGSPLEVEEVKVRIREAQQEAGDPAELFPQFFEKEPRFPSADIALRLFGNLFGLWDRMAAGGPVEPAEKGANGVARRRQPAAPPTPPGAGPLTDEFVEGAWRYIADLPEREVERLSHKYENTQPALFEYVREAAAGSDQVLDNSDTLVFEVWTMLELARPGEKLRAVSAKELAAASGATESPEPALDRYIDEAVTEAAIEDEEPLSPDDGEKVRRIALTAVRALTAARGAE